jgi:hypothetical protein
MAYVYILLLTSDIVIGTEIASAVHILLTSCIVSAGDF